MDWKKLWPSIVTGLPTLLAPFYEQITLWISAHPSMAMILATLATIIANVTKAPQQPPSA